MPGLVGARISAITSVTDGYALSGGNHFTLPTDQTSTSKASA
jgi:hypothetical protein